MWILTLRQRYLNSREMNEFIIDFIIIVIVYDVLLVLSDVNDMMQSNCLIKVK